MALRNKCPKITHKCKKNDSHCLQNLRDVFDWQIASRPGQTECRHTAIWLLSVADWQLPCLSIVGMATPAVIFPRVSRRHKGRTPSRVRIRGSSLLLWERVPRSSCGDKVW